MFGQFDVRLVGMDDPVCTPLQGGFELDDVRASVLTRRNQGYRTKGIISAGSVTSLWAISSLNLIRSPMLTSQ